MFGDTCSVLEILPDPKGTGTTERNESERRKGEVNSMSLEEW